MSDDFTQFVKQQADIVRIIGEYVKLRKSGARTTPVSVPFTRRRPARSRSTPQKFLLLLRLSRDGRRLQVCTEMDNISFPEALRVVATKCGIPLPKREFNSPEEAHEAG